MNDDGAPAPSGEEGASRSRLATLKVEHEDMEAAIGALQALTAPDQVRIARFKKRKLLLRDEIVRLEDQLTPDIIA